MFKRFIAWRYLSSRFITLAAFLLVSVSVAILLILLGVMEGFRSEIIDRTRGTSTDIKIDATKFEGLENPESVVEVVEGLDRVRAASPYVNTLVVYEVEGFEEFFYGNLNLLALDLEIEGREGRIDEYVENTTPPRLRRVLPFPVPGEERGSEPTTTDLPPYPRRARDFLDPAWYRDGLWRWNRQRAHSVGLSRLLRTEPPPDLADLTPILFGDELFRTILGSGSDRASDLLIGQVMRLTTISPVTNQLETGRFLLAGTFKSKDVEQDNMTVILDLDSASEYLDLVHPETGVKSVSGLRVFLDAEADADAVKPRVEEALAAAQVPFFRVQTWREEKAKMLGAVQMEKALMGIILGVIVIFVGLMVFIILTVQLVERTRDLGVLQAVGATSTGITGIYMRIGFFICTAGVALGVLVGYLFCSNIETIQRYLYILLDFELFPRSIYYIDTIPVRLTLLDFVSVILPTIVVSFLASLIAAWRASLKNPIQALKSE